jgi:hypothetical protein
MSTTFPAITPGSGGAFAPPATVAAPALPSNVIGGFPALRTGGAAGSNIDPALRPYLGLGLQRAEQLFFGEQPSFYPGQTYVSPSQQTLDALAAQEAIARGTPQQLQQAQQAYNQALAQTGYTAGGGFLGSNPFLQGAIQSATRPLVQQFQEQTLPGIQSAFSSAGRYGSGAQARAIGQAQESVSRAIGDVAGQMSAADYARERQIQQQAIGQQATLGAQAPSFFAQQFLPSEQLAQIGASREALATRPLQEAISRYQYSQQLPFSQLQSFLSAVYGNPMASSQQQIQQPAQPSRVGTALGTAALGAGLGSVLGGSQGLFGLTPQQTTIAGGVLGGLGGLLF